MKQCSHFEWLDEYIERIQEIDLVHLPLEAEKFGSGPSESGVTPESGIPGCNAIGATVGDAVVTAELNKLNKQMKKLIELKKQGNFMAGLFYACVIALAFVHVMIISRQ